MKRIIPMNQKFLIIALVFLIIAGIIARLFAFGSIPAGLYWDEIAMLSDAKSVAQTGKDIHGNFFLQTMFPSYGDYKLPIYIWLASASVKILGATAIALRLPSLMAGIFSIFGTGYLAVLLFGESLKNSQKRLLFLSASVVSALSPWGILFSRTGFEGHLAQALVLLAAIIYLRKPSFLSSVISSMVAVLSVYTYFSVRFVWPIVFIAMWMLVVASKKLYQKKNFNELKRHLSFLAVSGFVFALLLIPMFNSKYYEPSQQLRLATDSLLSIDRQVNLSNGYKEIAGNTLLDRLVFHRYVFLAKDFALNVTDHLSPEFLFLTGDANLRHSTNQHGLLLLIFLPIFILGWYKIFRWHPFVGIFLVIWWLVALVPASIPETTPHALRSLNAFSPHMISTGFGLYSLLLIFSKRLWLSLTALLIIFIFFLQFCFYYFTVYPTKSAIDWQSGFTPLAQKLDSLQSDVDQVLIEPFDSLFYLHLLSLDSTDANYVQSLDKDDYRISNFKNYVFGPIDWDLVGSPSYSVLVVGRDVDIREKINSHQIKPDWIEEVQRPYTKDTFLIAHYGK